MKVEEIRTGVYSDTKKGVKPGEYLNVYYILDGDVYYSEIIHQSDGTAWEDERKMRILSLEKFAKKVNRECFLIG